MITFRRLSLATQHALGPFPHHSAYLFLENAGFSLWSYRSKKEHFQYMAFRSASSSRPYCEDGNALSSAPPNMSANYLAHVWH